MGWCQFCVKWRGLTTYFFPSTIYPLFLGATHLNIMSTMTVHLDHGEMILSARPHKKGYQSYYKVTSYCHLIYYLFYVYYLFTNNSYSLWVLDSLLLSLVLLPFVQALVLWWSMAWLIGVDYNGGLRLGLLTCTSCRYILMIESSSPSLVPLGISICMQAKKAKSVMGSYVLLSFLTWICHLKLTLHFSFVLWIISPVIVW